MVLFKSGKPSLGILNILLGGVNIADFDINYSVLWAVL